MFGGGAHLFGDRQFGMDGWEMGLEGNGEGVFLKKKKDFMDWLWRDKRSICENSTASYEEIEGVRESSKSSLRNGFDSVTHRSCQARYCCTCTYILQPSKNIGNTQKKTSRFLRKDHDG